MNIETTVLYGWSFTKGTDDINPEDVFTHEPYRDGEPCRHKGCLHHINKRCEGCGRIAGRYAERNEK